MVKAAAKGDVKDPINAVLAHRLARLMPWQLQHPVAKHVGDVDVATVSTATPEGPRRSVNGSSVWGVRTRREPENPLP
jgi:hypothetical protein